MATASASPAPSPFPSLPPSAEPSDAAQEYPALPRLGSRLSCMVYSHKGVYGTAYVRAQEYIQEPQDNERLTFVGAAALQLCVGMYLYERYPKKVVGFLTQMRALLVSSEMLAHWARAYGMPAQLRGHASSVDNLRGNAKIAASVFEAFVGALVEGLGTDAARAWLTELLDTQLALTAEEDIPRLVAALDRKRTPSPVEVAPAEQRPAPATPEAKNRLGILNERASQLGKILVWTEEPQGPEHSKSWKLAVSVDGVVVGKALGDRKHSAKIAAAEEAWETLGWK